MVLDSKGRRRPERPRNGGTQKTASIWQRHPEYGVLVGLGFCLFLALALVALPASSAHMGYEVLNMRQELTRLERESARLKLEISRLESLDRIEEVARNELGMTEADQVKTVMVDTPYLYADTAIGAQPAESMAQRITAGLVSFVARAVAGRPAQAGNQTSE